jgi:hypothetical protein
MIWLVVLVSAALASGCGAALLSSAWDVGENEHLGASTVPGADATEFLPTGLLLGATEDEGPGPDEVDTAPAAPGGAGGVGLSARAGVFMAAGAEDVPFDPTVVVGVSYELPFMRSEALALELGADYASVSNPDRKLTSTMILVSASARLTPGGGSVYLTGSGTALLDNYANDEKGTSGSSVIPAVGVGAGLRPAEGSWDIRAGYSFLVGSKNLQGVIAITGGFCF